MLRVLQSCLVLHKLELYLCKIGHSAFFAPLQNGAGIERGGDEVLFRVAQQLTPSVSNSGLAVMMEGPSYIPVEIHMH